MHGINGIFGVLVVGLFAKESGLFFGGGGSQLVTQTIGVLSISLFSFVATYLILQLMKKTSGIRVSKEVELSVLNAASLGIESYSTFE